MGLEITRIVSTEFAYTVPDIGTDEYGFNLRYDPGNELERKTFALRIETDGGVTGEFVGGTSPGAAQINMIADYLIGKNPLEREKHWSELKRALRKFDGMGIGPLDIALWDLAGKRDETPIHELLGTYRTEIPAYASTYSADDAGGLDSPDAFADFAEECYEMGYSGFKIHPWSGSDAARDINREIELVTAVGERVGDRMALMIDPACEYETFMDALRVGRACDEQNFFWYEDPYRDTGISQHSHRKLRQMLDTPLLQTEHIRGLEPKTDFVANEGTDLVRVDPVYDGGITGAMKVVRMAEGFGLDTEFHAPGPAQRHCIAATRNTNFYELALVHPDCSNSTPPVYLGDYADELDSITGEGCVSVPNGPGLGVDYDWDFILENKTGSVHEYT